MKWFGFTWESRGEVGEEERCGDGHDGRRQKSEGIHFSLEISKRIKNFNVRESLELSFNEISIKNCFF